MCNGVRGEGALCNKEFKNISHVSLGYFPCLRFITCYTGLRSQVITDHFPFMTGKNQMYIVKASCSQLVVADDIYSQLAPVNIKH